jgi:hypothetical protein
LQKDEVCKQNKQSVDSESNEYRVFVETDPALFKTHKLHSDSEIFTMLTGKDETSENFPQTKGRRYLPSWQIQYSWLRYSSFVYVLVIMLQVLSMFW